MSGASAHQPKVIGNHAYKVMVNEIKDIAIFFLNPEGEIVSWNKGAERLKGYSENEVIGKHYRMLFTDKDIEEKRPEAELKEAKEIGRAEEEGFRKRKDGSQFRAHIILTRQLDENDKLIGYFKITRDITERYNREREAVYKSEEIERLSKLKDEFINIASHELKNPLTTLKAYMQLLKDTMATERENQERCKDYILKSYKQVHKLENLINEMLNASRIGAGKLELNLSTFDLVELASEVVENIKQTSPKHTIKIESTREVQVYADLNRIEQVIVNYLTNAIRYSPKGSEINVTVEAFGNQAELRIKDQGIGLSKEDKAKVFDRFFRSEGKGKKAGGLGLGLYIVKGIIRQHGGEVGVESEQDKGSTFYFIIPVNTKR